MREIFEKQTYYSLIQRSIDHYFHNNYKFKINEGSTLVDVYISKPVMDSEGIVFEDKFTTTIDYAFISEDLIKTVNDLSIIINKIKGKIIYNNSIYNICNVVTPYELDLITGNYNQYYRVPANLFCELLKSICGEDAELINASKFLSQILFEKDWIYDVLRSFICECGSVMSPVRNQLNLKNENYFNSLVYDRKLNDVLMYKKVLPQHYLSEKENLKKYYDFFKSNFYYHEDKTNTDVFKFQLRTSFDPFESFDCKSSVIDHIGIPEFNKIYNESFKKTSLLAENITSRYTEYVSKFTNKKIKKPKLIVNGDKVTVKVKYK